MEKKTVADAERIAFVCPRFSQGSTVGGAETLMKNLAARLVLLGRKVSFLTTCASDHFTWKNELPEGESDADGIKLIRFPVDGGRDISLFLDVQARISRYVKCSEAEELAWIQNSVNSSALCGFLAENGGNYDKIIVGPYLFGLTYNAARLLPEKTIILPCLHDEGFAHTGIIGDMFKSASDFIFNSVPEKKLAQKLYSLPDEKCNVVGMGLEPFDIPDKPGIPGLKDKYVIYSGRRESAKGTPMLCDYINVFRKRSGIDIKLVLTGSGPVEAPPELRPHIVDLGFVSEQEKRRAMAGAVAFCHPSVNESLSIVILEAWLAGTPSIVHSQCDVTRYQCATSNGGLWFSTYPEFEEELTLLLQNPGLRNALAGSGREYVLREYSWDMTQKRLLRALDDA